MLRRSAKQGDILVYSAPLELTRQGLFGTQKRTYDVEFSLLVERIEGESVTLIVEDPILRERE